MRICTEAPRSGDGLGIAVNGDDGMPILLQARRQLAVPATDLKNAAAFRREESFNKIVGITRFEPHLFAF